MARFIFPVLYTLNIFLSACLLFSVQPLVSKILLPLLGGAANVWIVSVLFFQVLLLIGYAYAHLLQMIFRERLSHQALLHGLLLIIMIFILPIEGGEGLGTPNYGQPMLWQVSALVVLIAGPFFMLSANSPLLQSWFARFDWPRAKDPYYLYAASNAGSLIALISYPFLIEPFIGLASQRLFWGIGYGLFSILGLLCALPLLTGEQSRPVEEKQKVLPISGRQRRHQWLGWVCLAAIPSSLMLGLTSVVTSDIAAVPLFWVIPLALYLITFILSFSGLTVLNQTMRVVLEALVVGVIMSIMLGDIISWPLVGLYTVGFFVAAWICHSALYRNRPQTERLTEFYLAISVGGAMGGVVNSIVAPYLFNDMIEFYLVLILSLFVPQLIILCKSSGKKSIWQMVQEFFQGISSRWPVGIIMLLLVLAISLKSIWAMPLEMIFILFVAVIVVGYVLFDNAIAIPLSLLAVYLISVILTGMSITSASSIIYKDRNYYGVSEVKNLSKISLHKYHHGSTIHGLQFQTEALRELPLGYYAKGSGLDDMIEFLDSERDTPQRVAVVGLGTGTAACYGHDGRLMDFFEIDQSVVDIAQNSDLFTYLKHCPDYDIHVGDGRLMISKEPENRYDMVWLDAFSSDSIPIHLMTREAVATYLKTLKPYGALLFHTSNRYLDLKPPLIRLAYDAGMIPMVKNGSMIDSKVYPKVAGGYVYDSEYVAFLPAKALRWRGYLHKHGWTTPDKRPDAPLWRDDYSSILPIIKLANLKLFGQ